MAVSIIASGTSKKKLQESYDAGYTAGAEYRRTNLDGNVINSNVCCIGYNHHNDAEHAEGEDNENYWDILSFSRVTAASSNRNTISVRLLPGTYLIKAQYDYNSSGPSGINTYATETTLTFSSWSWVHRCVFTIIWLGY